MSNKPADNRTGRLIFHCDVNSAFLSWTATYRLHHLGETLDLRTVPAIVGGDRASRHGIVLAASIPAKRAGVKTAMPVAEALRVCPELTVVPPDYHMYVDCSNALLSILREVSPLVEQYSIDEAFCDMSSIPAAKQDPEGFANALRTRIREELGFTVNIGVSVNKLLAKMASDFRKPDLVHTLWPEEIPTKMWPLPVRDLFFIGRATERHLLSMGIHTIGEIAKTPETVLRGALKQHGSTVYRFANGIDNEPVIDTPPPNKGYGNSTTISHDVTDAVEAKQVLLHLCDTVGTRLRRDGVRAGVVTVSVRTYDLRWYSHQTVLSTPTNLTTELHSHACRLFDACWDHTPIRSLGVHTARVSGDTASRQLSFLDTTNYEKLDRMDRVVDAIRQRFGKRSVMRASLLPRPSADAAPQTPEADEDTPAEPSST
ncbi:MAG: DNA polymerase IV [Lachnospiraceae bacterium]|nr:DNA polymerase IV [Lachnospiraceae bacterium]